jgi:hypothetical protein
METLQTETGRNPEPRVGTSISIPMWGQQEIIEQVMDLLPDDLLADILRRGVRLRAGTYAKDGVPPWTPEGCF